MTYRDFITSLRSNYPEYNHLDDETLGDLVLEKYPVYREQIDDLPGQVAEAPVPVESVQPEPVVAESTSQVIEPQPMGLVSELLKEPIISPESITDPVKSFQNGAEKKYVVVKSMGPDEYQIASNTKFDKLTYQPDLLADEDPEKRNKRLELEGSGYKILDLDTQEFLPVLQDDIAIEEAVPESTDFSSLNFTEIEDAGGNSESALSTINKEVENWNTVFLQFVENTALTGDVEKSMEPITEYFNKFRDEDEKVGNDEVLTNIGEGVTNLLTLPVSLQAEFMKNPVALGWDFIKFLGIETPRMVGTLFTAIGWDPITETRIAFGDEDAVAYKEETVQTVKRHPVEHAIAPFLMKSAVKGIVKTPTIAKNVTQLVKDSDWYRKLTIEERGLVPQVMEEVIAKNPKMGEAELARMFPEKFKESFEARKAGEPVKTISDIELDIKKPIPVEPIVESAVETIKPTEPAPKVDLADNPKIMVMPDEGLKDVILRRVQDKLKPLETGQKALDIKDESMDAYLEAELYSSRVRHRLDVKEDIENQFFDDLSKTDVSLEELGTYMYAKHAPERNARIRKDNPDIDFDASGWNVKELGPIEDWIVGGSKHKEGMVELAERFNKEVIQERLDILYKSELIDKETYDLFKGSEVYENYVPLKGIANAETSMGVGRGFNLTGKDIIRAKGRKSQADNPVVQAIADLETTIIRSEKNTVSKALYRLIDNNPAVKSDGTPYWEVENIKYRPRYDKDGEVQSLDPTNLDRSKEMIVYFDGKPKKIIIHDPVLYNNLNNIGMGKSFPLVTKAHNYLRKVYTGWNPVFWITNFQRDLGMNMLMNVIDKRPGIALSTAKNVFPAMNGIRNARFGDGKSEWAHAFKDFEEQGGKMGWLEPKTIEQREIELSKRIDVLQGKGKFIKVCKSVGDFVDDVNGIFEQGTRLSTYKSLLDVGYSKKKASQIAKNITVNFNKKGELGHALNQGFLFYNASTQGSKNVAKGLFSKRGAGVAATMMGAGYTLSAWNRGHDEDSWDKISDFDKYTRILIPRPGGSVYRTPIMMPYGFNVTFAMGVIMEEVQHGGLSKGEAAGKMVDAFLSGFSPISGGDWIDALTPTTLRPLEQIKRNIKFTGGPIYPEDTYSKSPDSEKYFDSANPLSIAFSKRLNDLTGGTRKMEGEVSISPESIDHFIEFIGGGPLRLGVSAGEIAGGADIVDTPIGRIFSIGPSKWKAKREVYQLLNKSQTKKLTDGEIKRFNNSLRLAQEDDMLFEDQVEEFKENMEENQKVFELEKSDQDLMVEVQRFARKFNKKGFTQEDIDTYRDMVVKAKGRGLITRGQLSAARKKIKRASVRLKND